MTVDGRYSTSPPWWAHACAYIFSDGLSLASSSQIAGGAQPTSSLPLFSIPQRHFPFLRACKKLARDVDLDGLATRIPSKLKASKAA